MAAFSSISPALSAPQRSSSTVRSGGQDPARATNGALKMRRLFTAEKMDFTIDYWLTTAQKNALESFYSTNKDASNTIVWAEDGVTYTVLFAAPPQNLLMPGGWWQVRVRLMEV